VALPTDFFTFALSTIVIPFFISVTTEIVTHRHIG
jgi:hypothetical protein